MHLKLFNGILAKLQFNKTVGIRLIGDELADRGSNDYFILKVLEKLQQHNVPVEILVSNHGIEFIETCEKHKDFRSPMLYEGGHAPSLKSLQILVEKGLVLREEVLDIAKNAYQPTLKALSYSLSEDKSEITIYSHAGIGLTNIIALADLLKVDYVDDTAQQLADTIDAINIKFQEHVQNKTVHTLYDFGEMHRGYEGQANERAPFVFLMWNRFYQGLKRPPMNFNYRLNFVHGHDSTEKTHENIYNLDSPLGKFDPFKSAHNNIGEYTVLYSPTNQITRALAPVETGIEVKNKKQPEVKPTVITHTKEDEFSLDNLWQAIAAEKEGQQQAAD